MTVGEAPPKEDMGHAGGVERPVRKEFVLRPAARTAYYLSRGTIPRVRARLRNKSTIDGQSPIFIIGCGRSGTTLLGDIFSLHQQISYLYEPYYLWAAVDPITDALQLYSRGVHRCLLDSSFVTAKAERRFNQLLAPPAGMTLVEKSPINSLRIGYLDRLVPGARFIHIVRDGINVIRSIEKIAKVTSRIVFRPPLNDWWGIGDAKWTSLVRDGQSAGYYPDEVEQLITDAQRGAYEWLMSLREVDIWRSHLGSRLVELRYEDLTERPKETIQRITDSMGLSCQASWLEKATADVKSARHNDGEPLTLPPAMCADFNSYEERYGYRGRAVISSLAVNHSKPTGIKHSQGSDMRELTRCGNIEVTVKSSPDEVRAFSAEWAKFADEAGGSNPFVHPVWMLPWAERFVRRNEQMYLLAARQDGRLVGVAPFYRRSWGPGLAHSMQLWGTGRHNDLTEMPGLLVDQNQPRNVTRALIGALCARSRSWDWAYVPLQDPLWFEPDWLPRDGVIIALPETVRASVVRFVGECDPLPLKRNVRESLRRARNRLTRDFAGRWMVDRATSQADVLKAMTDLQTLHAARSGIKGKVVHPNMLRNGADASYLCTVVSAAADRDGVCIYRLLVDGRAIAALLVLRTRESSYISLSGMSCDAWQYSPVTLLQGCVMDDAQKLGHRYVNLSTGPNTAKLRWSEEILVHPEFVLVRDRPLSLAKFCGYSLASIGAAVQRERYRHRLFTANSPDE
jgi:CelD/BcsL family acetyltransferase involved in cellulose biosynthesis